MKLSVEFPSVAYREGPEAVLRLLRAIERIPPGPYNPAMPILEALMTLACAAAVTSRVTLGTEVLVLPQRFAWVSLNATAMFQAGARSVDAMIDALGAVHGRIRAEVG